MLKQATMKLLMIITFVFVHGFSMGQVKGNRTFERAVPRANEAHAEFTGEGTAISVSGLLNARADVYVAIFHIRQVGATPEATDGLMNERIDKLKTFLTA